VRGFPLDAGVTRLGSCEAERLTGPSGGLRRIMGVARGAGVAGAEAERTMDASEVFKVVAADLVFGAQAESEGRGVL